MRKSRREIQKPLTAEKLSTLLEKKNKKSDGDTKFQTRQKHSGLSALSNQTNQQEQHSPLSEWIKNIKHKKKKTHFTNTQFFLSNRKQQNQKGFSIDHLIIDILIYENKNTPS